MSDIDSSIMIEYNLNKYLNKFENTSPKLNYDDKNKNYALILETRPSLIFVNVLKNFLHFFKNFNLIVAGNKLIFDLTVQYFGKNFIPIELKLDSIRINYDIYNHILTEKNFWLQVPGNNVLILQADCIFFRSKEFHNFDRGMIGPVCGYFDQSKFIMNGGLSLRKKQLMIEICKFKKKDEKVIEDIFFTNFIRSNYPELMPSYNECMDFAIESYGNTDKVIGLHGADKYYCNTDLIKECILKSDFNK